MKSFGKFFRTDCNA